MIVTIARQMGAGGTDVSARVGAALGWQVVDNELIDRVAASSGLSRSEVAEKDERAPGFLERLLRLLTKAAPEIFPAPADEVPELEEAKLVKLTEAAVLEMAAKGRVVLVGRAAAVLLRSGPVALHVKLVAPRTTRIEAMARREKLGLKEAEALVDDADGNRQRYYRQYYDRDWNDASGYHLVLNTGWLGIESAADLIVAEARRLFPLPAEPR